MHVLCDTYIRGTRGRSSSTILSILTQNTYELQITQFYDVNICNVMFDHVTPGLQERGVFYMES